MAFNYVPLKNSATSLIQKFGQSITLEKATAGAFDPDTGTISETTAQTTFYGVVLDATDSDYATLSRANAVNDYVIAGDKRITAEAGDYDVGDVVIIASKRYTIVENKPLDPAGTQVICELLVRA